MNRKKLLTTSAAATAASLAFPTFAEAGNHKKMESRFDAELELRRDGLVVVAAGPLDVRERGAVFVAAVVVQGYRLGRGISERYDSLDKRWDAVVEADHDGFRPGGAMAHGVVVLPEDDEVYTYAWSMHVELVRK